MPFTQRSLVLAAVITLCCLLLPSACTEAIPIEKTVSTRKSVRQFTGDTITSQLLLEVLRDSYGVWGNHRSVPQVGDDYSLTIFPVNDTGSYRYVPADNSLLVHDLTVNKETIRPHNSNWPSDADVVLVIVWNQTRMGNSYFSSAETGCLVQNVYLSAATRNLGTTCVSSIDSEGLRNDLTLPDTMIPFIVMPLGHPAFPYPDASPDYSRMTNNLPPVLYGDLSFTDSLSNMLYAQNWPSQNLSLQELSQLLWASYGYSSTDHRATPSAGGVYPLVIYVSNATAIYRYTPENHSTIEIQSGDKRLDIATACDDQSWAANAPAIFLVAYNSSYNDGNTYDYGVVPHGWMEINTGCVVQQLLLEASAWNLSANVVSRGFEQWNSTAAEELRDILGAPPSLVPLYIVPAGHRTGCKLNICVKDWDLTDSIQGAYVHIDSRWTTTDESGWANWTDLSGDVAIKVKWLGAWVFGPLVVTMDADKAMDVRCNIFDIIITCVEEKQQSLLQYANVTVLAGENKIQSEITDHEGKAYFTNVPNSTLTFLAFDGNINLIANTMRTITSEEQAETIICDANYETSQIAWAISEVFVQSSLAIVSLLSIIFITSGVMRLKKQHQKEDPDYLRKGEVTENQTKEV